MSLALHQDVIDACHRCAATCDACLAACLEEDDIAKLDACMRLDIQCAAICRLQALLFTHDSQFARQLLPLCIEVCHSCAEACSEHEHEHCQACAQACQHCAQACEEVAA